MRTLEYKEFEILPHVVMTSNGEWDPTTLDSEVDIDTDEWFDAVPTELPREATVNRRVDDVGDYRHRHVMQHSYMRKYEEEEIFHDDQLLLEANECITTTNTINCEATFRSPNPAVNVLRRPEAAATNTVFFDVPAVDPDEMTVQIFVVSRAP
jgi:hypothetical protein